MSGLPLKEAAQALDVAEITLRRWIAQGAPVARRGGRGRGRATLVDVQAVRRWRDGGVDAVITSFASVMPRLLSDACTDTFRRIDGPHKRHCGPVLAAVWYRAATAMLDHLREHCPTVPDVTAIPTEVEMLRKIASK